MAPSRRSFLNSFGSLLGLAAVSPTEAMRRFGKNIQTSGATDEEILSRTFALAARRGLVGDDIGEAIDIVGSSFIGAPYAAHTLEEAGAEHLVVNLREFDCTTFVESVLALSRCASLGTPTSEAFRAQLQKIRYRDGVIQGYPSRLHYFIDWVGNNALKGIVRNVTFELGGVAVSKPIDFMSTHPDAYRQLAEKSNRDAIAEIEKRLSAQPYAVLPRQAIPSADARVRNGDIIALATAVQGLDVSHIGFALRTGGETRFLHAPLSGGAVQVSEHSLAEYVAGVAKATGIIVARPLNP